MTRVVYVLAALVGLVAGAAIGVFMVVIWDEAGLGDTVVGGES